jgi:hypothetical protein
MMPSMDSAAIERAERVALRLEAGAKLTEAVKESKEWKRPRSFRTQSVKPSRIKNYEFTDKQLEIAIRSLDAKDSV